MLVIKILKNKTFALRKFGRLEFIAISAVFGVIAVSTSDVLDLGLLLDWRQSHLFLEGSIE